MNPGAWTDDQDREAVWPGEHQPLGATWSEESTNFAVYAPEATRVQVCLVDDTESGERERRFELTAHTLGIWHGAIPGVRPGQRYGFRADGPWDPENGHLFNPAKFLLDPYARAVSGEVVPGPALFGYVLPGVGDDKATQSRKRRTRSDVDSAPAMAKSVVVHDEFDWSGEVRPRVRWTDTVVYELHTKGFTALHDRVPQELRGTYAGLATPAVVDYLKDLGITTVELLPVHQYVPEPDLADKGLTNYWGYNSIGFFAPHNAYSASGDRGQQVTEFKSMVKAFHAAGLEVVLDVVYNHTAEGSPLGPTLSFRGLDDRGYYKRVDPVKDPATYWDVTGCGNTVDASHPFALRMILDSLRYWATEMHVDGFRFDLTSALARTGHVIDMRGAFMTAIQH
ncbi:MAG: alpha-amylase family glycosyl hydrolase, partial [Nocardioidaceae bacterium]